MEEVQQPSQNPAEKHSSAPLVVATIFVLIYFLFPVILIYPVLLFYGKNQPLPPRVEFVAGIVFYPVFKLADTVPAYKKMIAWEGRLLGLH